MNKIEHPLPHNNPSYDHLTSWSDASAEQSHYDMEVYCACGRQICESNKKLEDDYSECEGCHNADYCEGCGEEITDDNPASNDDCTSCLSCDTYRADLFLDMAKDPD